MFSKLLEERAMRLREQWNKQSDHTIVAAVAIALMGASDEATSVGIALQRAGQ